jgi:putative CocE/NonD family hydrolase
MNSILSMIVVWLYQGGKMTRSRLNQFILLSIFTVLVISGCASTTPSMPTVTSTIAHPASVTASDRISRPGKYEGYSHPLYVEWVKTSQYVTVRDGTKLAVDIYRPVQDGKPVSTPLPVIWTHDRYHRENESTTWTWLQTVMAYGYIIGAVDVRGGGASFGTQQEPWSPEETRDAYDITEWFAAQPWSTGNIGMYGVSYLGITQYMAASTKPPHLKAIFPEMAMFDLYSLAYPGGVFHNDMIAQWNDNVKSLDTWGTPVDEDRDGSMLAAALQEHKANRDVFELATAQPYRDSADPISKKQFYRVSSPSTYLTEVGDSGVAIYHWAGWYDAFTRDALIWFDNLDNPQKIVIGPWSHTDTSNFDIAAEHLRWYDYWLKGIDNGIMNEAPIYYYTMGAGVNHGWHSAWQWPLPDQRLTKYYFGGEPSGSVDSINDGSLILSAPEIASGQDYYLVDYSTTSGTSTRWDNSSGGGSFAYPDLTHNDRKGLTYTTSLLTGEVDVTGHPVVHLWVTTTTKDSDFFVYMEDVDKTGDSHYITEGTLRASHRTVSTPPYDNLGLPYHRSYAEDIADLPGRPVELVFDLLPTSYAFDVGHRIRITITCADKDNALTPELNPPPTVSLYREADYASYIMLPIIPNP